MKYLLLYLLVLFPLSASAARLYVTIPDNAVHVGDIVPATLMLDTEGADVNALEGELQVSANLTIAGIREEDSVVQLWVERPTIQGKMSSFSGVIPGGFRGVLGPFWKGGRPGPVYTLLLEANGTGNASVAPALIRVLANDGAGTMLPVTTTDARFMVLPGTGEQEGVPADNTPPEEFLPAVSSSPDLFDGDAFIAFSATDRESGVDHYEIAETWTARVPDRFDHAESPYRLKDQKLRSYVHVKAVDRAENERVVTMPPAHPAAWYRSWWAAILVLALLLSLFYVYRRRFHHA